MRFLQKCSLQCSNKHVRLPALSPHCLLDMLACMLHAVNSPRPGGHFLTFFGHVSDMFRTSLCQQAEVLFSATSFGNRLSSAQQLLLCRAAKVGSCPPCPQQPQHCSIIAAMASGTTERTRRWRVKQKQLKKKEAKQQRRQHLLAPSSQQGRQKAKPQQQQADAVPKASPPLPRKRPARAVEQAEKPAAASCGAFGMHPGRLRSFQHWLRRRAPPAWRRVHLAAEVARSQRIVVPGEQPGMRMRLWLAALVCFWWLDAASRDTVVPLLAMSRAPDWDKVLVFLNAAADVVRHHRPRPIDGPTGMGRRGPGANAERGLSRVMSTMRTLRIWHQGIADGSVVAVAALADDLETQMQAREAGSDPRPARRAPVLPLPFAPCRAVAPTSRRMWSTRCC